MSITVTFGNFRREVTWDELEKLIGLEKERQKKELKESEVKAKERKNTKTIEFEKYLRKKGWKE